MMLIPGLVSITFRPLSPRAVVDLVAKAGLKGIEWGGDVHVPHGDLVRAKEVAAMTTDAGLDVAVYGSYYRAGQQDEKNPPAEAVVETAAALGAPSIRIWPGALASKDADEKKREAIAQDIARIAALARPHKIRIGLEYHGGTLTDDNDSAAALIQQLHDLGATDVQCNWQPPNGMAPDKALAGMKQVGTVLGNLHVFSWTLNVEVGIVRHPLQAHEERWKSYLAEAEKSPCAPGQTRYALMEFVPDDTPENFLADAAVLRQWLGC